MDKKFIFNLLYVVLIVGVIAFMIWIVFWLKTESASCLHDPIKYYSEKIGTQCYCMGDFGG